MNLREDSIKYDYLVVFIRHGSAEIWGFQYGVTFGLGTLEIMARTGIFGLVVCALNCATKSDPSEPSMILVFLTCKKNLSLKFFDLDVDNSFTRGVLAKFEPTL